jgi:DNA topoisomerase-1
LLSLQCENVEMVPPNKIKFDFLGKDSIKYENTVETRKEVREEGGRVN